MKAALAGQRGICPDCGARVQIPGAESEGQVQIVPTQDLPPDDIPAISSQSTVGRQGSIPPIPPLPPSRSVGAGPSSSSKDALWYIRPASGGQYGPATTEVVRQWIAEGRVTNASWVWRTDWSDWKRGEDALSGWATPPSEFQPTPLSVRDVGAGEGAVRDWHALQLARRRRRRQTTLALTVLVALLATLLGFVLMRS